jgi:hypothetical protein
MSWQLFWQLMVLIVWVAIWTGVGVAMARGKKESGGS